MNTASCQLSSAIVGGTEAMRCEDLQTPASVESDRPSRPSRRQRASSPPARASREVGDVSAGTTGRIEDDLELARTLARRLVSLRAPSERDGEALRLARALALNVVDLLDELTRRT